MLNSFFTVSAVSSERDPEMLHKLIMYLVISSFSIFDVLSLRSRWNQDKGNLIAKNTYGPS